MRLAKDRVSRERTWEDGMTTRENERQNQDSGIDF